jgi:hypothetical protein
MPAVHEQHRLNTAAHVAQLAADAVKTARLQSIGSVPPLAEQPWCERGGGCGHGGAFLMTNSGMVGLRSADRFHLHARGGRDPKAGKREKRLQAMKKGYSAQFSRKTSRQPGRSQQDRS